MKKLVFQSNSDIISFNNFLTIHNWLSPNTSFSLTNAESMPLAEFTSLLSGTGTKKIDLSIGESSVNQALTIMRSALGENTTINLEATDGYPLTSMPDIIAAVGQRDWSIEIRGNLTSHASAVSIINGFSGENVAYTLLSLNAMPESTVSAVLEAIGGKPYTVTLDARHSSPSKIIHSLNKISSSTIEIGSRQCRRTRDRSRTLQYHYSRELCRSRHGRDISGDFESGSETNLIITST